MTLTDLVLSLPVPRSVLRTAARALRPARRARATARFEMLGLGLALGAGAALLLAPKSGRELRRQLFARFDGAARDFEENADAQRAACEAVGPEAVTGMPSASHERRSS
jgi:YtxH-like protein